MDSPIHGQKSHRISLPQWLTLSVHNGARAWTLHGHKKSEQDGEWEWMCQGRHTKNSSPTRSPHFQLRKAWGFVSRNRKIASRNQEALTIYILIWIQNRLALRKDENKLHSSFWFAANWLKAEMNQYGNTINPQEHLQTPMADPSSLINQSVQPVDTISLSLFFSTLLCHRQGPDCSNEAYLLALQDCYHWNLASYSYRDPSFNPVTLSGEKFRLDNKSMFYTFLSVLLYGSVWNKEERIPLNVKCVCFFFFDIFKT